MSRRTGPGWDEETTAEVRALLVACDEDGWDGESFVFGPVGAGMSGGARSRRRRSGAA